MEDYKTVYTTVLQEGIALKRDAIQVCLHSINVSIHSPSIKEEGVKYDTDAVHEHQTMAECLLFQNSFKLGARMMVEVME